MISSKDSHLSHQCKCLIVPELIHNSRQQCHNQSSVVTSLSNINMLPTIVGVTGMWHPGSCFDDLATVFEKRGYPFVSQDAPGILSEDPINSTVDMDAESLRQNILLPLLAEGKDIILLMHSYGGVYGSAAVHGLSRKEREKAGQEGGIVGLVYVTAVTPAVGKSLLDMMGLTPENLPPHVVLNVS